MRGLKLHFRFCKIRKEELNPNNEQQIPSSEQSDEQQIPSSEQSDEQQIPSSEQSDKHDLPAMALPDDTIAGEENDVQGKKVSRFLLPVDKESWASINTALHQYLQDNFTIQKFKSLSLDSALSKLYGIIQSFFSEAKTKNKSIGKVSNQKGKYEELRRLDELLCSASLDTTMRDDILSRKKFLEEDIRLSKVTSDNYKSERNHQNSVNKFEEDPWSYGKQLFKDNKTSLACSDHDIIGHYTKLLSEKCPKQATSPPGKQCSKPEIPMNMQEISIIDVQKFLAKKSKYSAPGPNQIPYSIWKNCPCAQSYLVSAFNRVLKDKNIPLCWKKGITKVIPKELNSDASKTRPITMTNTDGKIFFGIVSYRLESYLEVNSIVDRRIQKGFARGIPGCIEHSSLLMESLMDASKNKRNICATFIDLRNAFGAVQHHLIPIVCRWFHLPDEFIQIISSYYSGLNCNILLKDNILSETLNVEVGLFQGCSLSVNLFVLFFQVFLNLLKTDKCAKQAYNFKTNPHMSVKELAFADDLLFITKSPEGAQYLLKILEEFLKWSQFEVNETKCKFLAFKHKSQKYVHLTDMKLKVGNNFIYPLCKSEHYKYLGLNISPNLKPVTDQINLKNKLNEGICLIDGCKIGGFQKIWLYNNFLIPRLSWILMNDDFSTAFISSLQTIGQRFLKKWSGIPKSANSAILYSGSTNSIGLKIKHINVEYKKLRSIKSALLKTSKDVKIHNTRSSNNKIHQEVDLMYKVINSEILTNRHGIGYKKTQLTSKETRKQVAKLIQDREIEKIIDITSKLTIQGQWTKWEDIMQNDMTWQAIINNKNENLIKFYLNSTLNTLPTRDNLRRWGVEDHPNSCDLCSLPQNLKHVLCCCSYALNQGRYRWRHNKILYILMTSISEEMLLRRQNQNRTCDMPFIHFVREGENASRHKYRHSLIKSCLDVGDWVAAADHCLSSVSVHGALQSILPEINRKYVPDIFMYNTNSKQCIVGELTCPWEENRRSANNAKYSKYTPLVNLLKNKGYEVTLFTFCVGSRGFVDTSVETFLKFLGFSANKINKIAKSISKVTILASYVIYLHRNSAIWSDFQLLQNVN